MLRLICRAVLPWLLVVSCVSIRPSHPTSAIEHERMARHYDAVADSIEENCRQARRNELTVADQETCWKAQDKRFLDANRDAAAEHRAAAAKLRASEYRRTSAAR